MDSRKENLVPYFASIAYAITWTTLLILYWTIFHSQANNDWYRIVSYWTVLPVLTAVVSFFYGTAKAKLKWFGIPLGAILLLLFQGFTFGNFEVSSYNWWLFLLGAGCSTVGILIGHLVLTYSNN